MEPNQDILLNWEIEAVAIFKERDRIVAELSTLVKRSADNVHLIQLTAGLAKIAQDLNYL